MRPYNLSVEMRHRRSIRMAGLDYSQPGTFFVTICTEGRSEILGEVVQDAMRLSAAGAIAKEQWLLSGRIRHELELDTFVVMPNHLHGLISIRDAPPRPALTGQTVLRRGPRSLGSFVAGFKSATTRAIRAALGAPGAVIWQRNYHEHVVRDQAALERVRWYIENNPASWSTDPENPNAQRIAADPWL